MITANWFTCLFSIRKAPNQSDACTGGVGGGTIAHPDYILDPMIRNESVDLLIQFVEFLHSLRDFQFVRKGLHVDYLLHVFERTFSCTVFVYSTTM